MWKICVVLVMLGLGACKPSPPDMSFVALGDAPYGNPETAFAPYETLIEKINAAAPTLVVHVGDTHGHYTCDDALMDRLRGLMNAFKAPVLYTPGDNEWTDCRHTEVGEFEPLDRLAYLRRTYFKSGKSLGARPEPVINQAKMGYPENARIMKGNVGFITVHVVGSNNNFNPSDPTAADEFYARNKANVIWLEQSFAALKHADAIVVALHADMFAPLSGFRNGWHSMSPYRDIGVTLGKQSSALEKPVLLLYGDSHEHKVFQPFQKHRPYLYAIEVYGNPDVKAIEIGVRPSVKHPFQVERVFDGNP